MYFVETPGGYTMEAMKACKSLEAYNYYYRLVLLLYLYNVLHLCDYSGWVYTVYYYNLGNGKHCLLKGL